MNTPWADDQRAGSTSHSTVIIIGAALAEGLGILSFVLGILLWTKA